jgi:hypothetical protein
MSQKTVTINGRVYDAHTGMPLDVEPTPVAAPQSSPKRSPLHHSAMHSRQQKSQTLNRRTVKNTQAVAATKSVTPKAVKQEAKVVKPAVVPAKSPTITKFAPHPNGVKAHVMSDIAPARQHPSVTKAHAKLQAQKHVASAHAPKPSHIVKQEVLKDALEKAPSKTDKPVKARRSRKLPRFVSVLSVSLAVLLLGGYFTYLNMPNLSVRVAAAQAGINASYPEYKPDGYSLRGPIGYNEGQVTMKFAANAGPQGYSVAQTKSNWDSSAVLDNYVKEKAGDNYITYNERGLTIYTFDGNAAWVNGGILYTINGDAPLSSDQIRRIATSM